MQDKKDVDLKKIPMITENIRFLSYMIHIYNELLEIHSKNEIDRILSLNKICSNSKLLYIMLINNETSLDEL